MQELNDLIQAVAGKLACDGLTTQNYSTVKAQEILSNCVAYKACLICLSSHEDEIKKLLPHILFEV